LLHDLLIDAKIEGFPHGLLVLRGNLVECCIMLFMLKQKTVGKGKGREISKQWAKQYRTPKSQNTILYRILTVPNARCLSSFMSFKIAEVIDDFFHIYGF